MTCSTCSHENPSGAKYCEECGAVLGRACANCGSELRPTVKFCSECGTPIAATGALASSPGPGDPRASGAAPPVPSVGARKIVTIVFADLVGSTALHERLDPESARRFMESYYDAMRHAVESHGGTVTQLLGDGVKAVFGIPRVAEDDAIRAVHAAVAMQDGFRTLAEQQRGAVGETGLRVAVNTGEVVANDDSEIIGDPVNVAARLQEQGANGDVVVGDSTARLVEALLTLVPLGSFALKGRAESVAAFRVESLERPANVAAAAFVGRDAEIARITSVYRTAVEKPATSLAVIFGSPGLGKSRLIDEFAHGLGDSATVVAAHCNEASDATFAPLALALRELFDIDASATGEALRAAIEIAIPGETGERARIANGIAALIAASPASPEETFFVVRRLLAALASVRPIVLILDDLQWAEPLLLDLVEHLVQWGSDVPLLVLVGARSELREKRSSLATPGGLVADVLTLAGLDAGAAMRLAANVIGAADLPAVVAAKVLATSEGNPLFVGELVRMLVHEGALKREGDRWTTGTALAGLEMPPTIHALLAARIERLHPEERMVLERAAVVGRTFSRSAVVELLPRGISDLDARLESLRRSELIERDTGWFLGEPVLRFHHLLIRDAAYRQLLKGTRAELHVRFADWALARAVDSVEHDEMIGWHLEQAHQFLRELGPIDAQGRAIGERASTHLSAAGRRALARDDVPLAASLLGRAIDRLDPGDPARGEIALDWCEALLAMGDVGTAARAIDELDRFVADSVRLRAWHTCFSAQHTVLTAPQELQTTATTVAAAAEALAAQRDDAGEAKAHYVHALALSRLGKIGPCEAALDRALAAARRVAGDRRRANTVLAIAPLAALWGPSPVTRASGRCLDVVRVLRITQGAPAVEAVALSCQGVLEALRGRTEAARRMLASAREMVEELGITQRLLEVDVFSGLIELLEGDAPAAERSLRGAYHGLRELGLGIDAARAAALLARALLAQDRNAEAETLSHESEALAGDDLKAAIAWRGVRAEALARRGEHVAAVAFANRAVEMAAATDALLDHADARLALAAALRAAGRSREADAEERRASELWQAKGATLLAERERSVGARIAPAGAIPEQPKTAAPSLRGVRPNTASLAGTRLVAAAIARDFEGARALFHENHLEIDRPTGSSYGRDAAVASLERLFRGRDPYYEMKPLATLGESLALDLRRTGASGAISRSYDVAAYEQQVLHLIETGQHGLICHSETFAVARLDDAIACLYERHAAEHPEAEKRERAQMTARVMGFMLSTSTEIDQAKTLIAPDFESVDHRHLSTWSMRGAEAWIDHIRALRAVADDIDICANKILALEPDVLLVERMHSGTDRVGGGAYERPFLVIFAVGSDGRLVRAEWFDAERESEALARLDASFESVASPQPAPFANAATHVMQRMVEVWRNRDWSGFAQVLAMDFRCSDRRPMAQLELDRDQWIEFSRQLGDMGSWRIESEVLATRGERLALTRIRLVVSDAEVGPSELEYLDLSELDLYGRVVSIVRFERHDEDAAYAELGARFEAGEGATYPHVIQATYSMTRAIHDRDWDALAALYAPGFAYRDHRLLGFGSTIDDPAKFVRAQQALAELAPDARTRERHLRVSQHGALRQITQYGHRDGGAFENLFFASVAIDEQGLIVSADVYDIDRFDLALARFEALATPTSRPVAFANAATRASDRLIGYWRERDWERTAQMIPSGFRFQDRRRMAQLDLDREGYLESSRVYGEMQSARMHVERIATRGERLALSRHRLELAGGDIGPSELVNLTLVETDEQGDLIAIIRFDVADEIAAWAELEARFAAGEAAAHPSALAALVEGVRALEAHDWSAFAARFAPDMVCHDHRLLGWGTLHGVAEFVRMQQLLVELAPDTQWTSHHVEIAEHGLLLSSVAFGTRDGGPFELPFIRVNQIDDSHKIVRTDIYDVDQSEQAHARFSALSDATSPPAASAPTTKTTKTTKTATRAAIERPNAAKRAMDRWYASYDHAFETDDWVPMHRLCTAEFLFQDRRRMALVDGDLDLMIASARERVAIGARPKGQLAGTAGDRIAIERILWSGGPSEGRFEIEYFGVFEIDPSGLLSAFVLFDIDDARSAQREAWARWAAVDPDVTAVVTPLGKCGDAFNEQNADRFCAALADDVVVEDHRLAGIGRVDGAPAYTASLVALWQLAPITQGELGWFWPAFNSHGAVTVLHRAGRLPDGGEFESEYLYLYLAAEGRITRVEMFELEAVDEALARFEVLCSNPLLIPPNAAVRARGRWTQAAVASDWDAIRRLTRADFVFEDRGRRALVLGDVETWIASVEYTRTLPGIQIRNPLLATLGDRIAIDHLHWSGHPNGDAFEFERLRLIEVDAEGLFRTAILFDLEDRASAFTEADARFAVGEAAGLPAQLAIHRLLRAWSAKDWAATREAFAENIVIADHRRPSLLGSVGRDAWIESWRVGAELAPNVSGDWLGILAWNPHGRVWQCRVYGTRDGGDFENLLIMLAVADATCVRHYEFFDSHEAVRAIARLDELSPDPLRVPPNAATRATDRVRELRALGDPDALRESVTDDFCFDDRMRRSLVRGGIEEWLGALQFLWKEMSARFETSLIATAGDRLALDQIRWREARRQETTGQGPFELNNFRLTEVDSKGKIRALVLFSLEDRAAAHAELFERYVTQGADGMPAAAIEFTRALNDHDLERLRAALPDDLVVHDRRRTGIGRIEGADAWLESAVALYALSSDVRIDDLYTVAVAPHGRVSLGRMAGTNAEGGEFESFLVRLFRYAAEKIAEIEVLEVEDLAAALVRFEKLGGTPRDRADQEERA